MGGEVAGEWQGHGEGAAVEEEVAAVLIIQNKDKNGQPFSW